MDEIDRKIVALLRANARRSFQDIGGRVSLSAPAVKRRVDRLEAAGVIRAYAALVDPAAMGWRTPRRRRALCEGRMAAAEVRGGRPGHPEVAAAYTVAGEASAILHVRAATRAHLEEALERIRDTPGSSAPRRRSSCRRSSSDRWRRPRRPRSRSPGPRRAASGAGVEGTRSQRRLDAGGPPSTRPPAAPGPSGSSVGSSRPDDRASQGSSVSMSIDELGTSGGVMCRSSGG
jgi:DNA-binding Lrp family transcriptional regulator